VNSSSESLLLIMQSSLIGCVWLLAKREVGDEGHDDELEIEIYQH